MCGIVGILKLNRTKADPAPLAAMIDLLRHRGPDDTGVHQEGHVALGHSRLSIIDLDRGHQPMGNEDGTIWITFNGEIYNYVELRQELLKRGHRFATESDTEVVLHLYEEHGDECVGLLNGQWAFAIWDGRRGRLLLSRDRLGIRPLFYTQNDGVFVFASEVKAILAYPGIPRRLDLAALDQVFTFWHALPPRTMFEGVNELPPGHCLVLEDGRCRVRSYWEPAYGSSPLSANADEIQDRLLELLEDATRLRLRADVPVGAYLSGGLDSSVITALVQRFATAPVKSFSVTFEDSEFDESRHQEVVLAALETDHHAIRCSCEDIGAAFPDVVWRTEKPILRTAPVPLFILSRLVSEHGYKVVLAGEGSDEILGGYDIYKEAKIRRFWAADLESRLRPLLLRRLYPYLPAIQRQSLEYLKAAFHVAREDLSDPYFSHLPRWRITERIKMFFSREVKRQMRDYSCYAELDDTLPRAYSDWDEFDRAQYLETRGLLPGYILSSQGDRMAMAHSVEGRFPFLDHRVVEFSQRIPANLKLKVLNEKYVLKKTAADLIPASIRLRSKQPYRAPDAVSFVNPTTGGMRQRYVAELLSEDSVRRAGLFDPGAVSKLVEKARNGRLLGIKDNMAFVGILSTQLFVNEFIDGFGVNGVI